MREWISVEDKLPEPRKTVLALYRWPHQSKLNYALRQRGDDDDWYNEHGKSMMNVHHQTEPVKFWTHVPNPPKSREE